MPSTGDRRPRLAPQVRAARPVQLTRRRVLIGLAAFPAALTLSACTGDPQPQPSGSSTDGDGTIPTTPVTEAPRPDTPALESAATAAVTLLAAYEATASRHPTLGPVLAPYAADHDAHLEALAEWITVPTTTPGTTPGTTTSGTTSAASPGTSPSGSPGPSATAPAVPADPAAARAAIVQAEEQTGEAARDAARKAEDGEVARLLASIGASRAVHALLLGAPA